MASLFPPPPAPPTKLGRYRTLSPLAGVRVSPLQLGAMSIGDKWHEHGLGSMDKESSFKLLDAYFDAGVSRAETDHRHTVSLILLPRAISSILRTISELPTRNSDQMHGLITILPARTNPPRFSSANGLRSVAYATSSSLRLRYYPEFQSWLRVLKPRLVYNQLQARSK
jgi:hypothetical protein